MQVKFTEDDACLVSPGGLMVTSTVRDPNEHNGLKNNQIKANKTHLHLRIEGTYTCKFWS